jgi:hypothetical protein
MPKNKIQFLNQIEAKVKDTAGEFLKTIITLSDGESYLGNTRFAVSSNAGFHIGDEVYIYDKNVNPLFTKVTALVDTGTIELEGDLTFIHAGASINKTGALDYLDEAVGVYSKFRPLEKIYTVTVPNPVNVVNLPQDWETGFSSINYIEYPAGNTPPALLDENDFEIFLDDDGEYKLRFTEALTGEIKISYNISNSFENSNPPVISAPDIDFYCITNIAAGIYLMALASRWGESSSGGLQADTVDYNGKTDRYRRLSKELFAQAASWLGVDISELSGGGATNDASSCNQSIEPVLSTGKPTLFHNNN